MNIAMRDKPLILGVGGTMRPNSSSERVLRAALKEAEKAGARTVCMAGQDLDLPMYAPGLPMEHAGASRLVSLLRDCDGLLISSPSYHGGMSGLIKNALDYTEELRDDARPYLDGRAVGCIVCVAGWQAVGTTLSATRSIVHALRGWPAPVGIGINTSEAPTSSDQDKVNVQIRLMISQVVEFAYMRRALALRSNLAEA